MLHRIAFLKLCCPGDLLFTTPAVRAVKSQYSSAQLYYLTGKYSSFIPKHNPHIDKTIIIEPPFETDGKIPALVAFMRGISRIARANFDLVICFHRSMILASMGVLGRAKTMLGFETATPMVDLSLRFDPDRHEVLRYLDLVSLIHCNHKSCSLEYKIAPADDELAFDLLQRLGISGDFAVIAPGGGENPGTTMHIKRWPAYGFRAVAKFIRERYHMPVIAVGSRSEKSLADATLPDLNLAGQTTFPILAAVLEKSRIVIANDSGPLYLASAVGANTVGIYGPSSDNLVGPLVNNHRTVKNTVWCQPCYHPQGLTRGKINCPTGTWACMLTIRHEYVCNVVENLLDELDKIHILGGK